MERPIRVSQEVGDALAAGRGVVALETSVLTQGLPWPDKVEAARRCLAAIRTGGSVPAPLPWAAVEGAVSAGVAEARRRRLGGKELTPFLLEAVARVTGGASCVANLALLEEDARVGGEVAAALARAD